MVEPQSKVLGKNPLIKLAVGALICLTCGCESAFTSATLHSPKAYSVVTALPSKPVPAVMLQQPPAQPPKKIPDQPAPAQPLVIVSNPAPSTPAPQQPVPVSPAKPVAVPQPEPERAAHKTESAPKIDLAAERAALMQRDLVFSETSEKKGSAEAFYEFMAADATLLREGEPPIKGKEAIKVRMAAGQQGTLTWKSEEATLSARADMGFTWGSYVFRGEGPERRITRGQYVTIWEKQNGQWKVVLWSSSISPATAPRRSDLGTQ